ncbi:non-canonical purine NTP pyrophosphatase, partial [Aeromonas diversa]
DKLLAELSGVPADLRTARFWCVLVFMRHENDPTPLICQASWEGLITEELRGQNGFGYDPVFFVPGEGCTSAELPAER